MEYTIEQTAEKLGIPENKIHAHFWQIDTVKRGKTWYITDLGVIQLKGKLKEKLEEVTP